MKVFVAVLFLMIGFTGRAWSQSYGSTPQEGQASPSRATVKTFEGELSRVDSQKQQLWVKKSDGTEMQFSYTKDTPIEGASGTTEGLSSMSDHDTQVKIEYEDNGGVHPATKISIQSRKP
jgi:hypothetical protein